MSAQPRRLSSGGLIDRSRTLGFTFDGRALAGHPGDTLASALIANDVRLVGRSFKYHRRRGVFSAGSEEPNALVELGAGARREPNTKATMIELFRGLTASSQNRWPSLGFDVVAANQLVAPMLGAGFYYKTFMWPSGFWEGVYEPVIRRAAGLGRAADSADPDTYEKVTAFCDVLVIGAGPAGLMAALAAARAGARVILAGEDFALGGQCLSDRRTIGGKPAPEWAASVEAELAASPEVRVLRRATVFGVHDGGTYGAVERVTEHLAAPPAHRPRQRLWRIVAKRAVLAAGATERPIVFGNNDRPGVMLAGAARTYVNRFGVAPGRRVVIFANNDSGAAAARDLHSAGIPIEALVESRLETSRTVREAAAAAGARLIAGGVVLDARAGRVVNGALVLFASGERLALNCDLIAVSGGWNPNLQLSTHLGGRPVWNEAIAAFTPGALPPGMTVAGSAGGTFTTAGCLSEGARAGSEAAEACGFAAPRIDIPEAEDETTTLSPLWHVAGARGPAFVDFQNDVTTKDIALAAREGFSAAEQMKRYTTLGMGTDQGRTASINGMAILAELTGRSIGEVGTTSARPPYTPVAIGALAGHHRGKDFKPERTPPSHAWAREQGAVFVDAGLWVRARYFPRPGERDWLETVTREVNTVRSAVGVCDVSTLGKIEIQGPDAAELLDRVYINAWTSLAVGRVRYGVMLREDGMVMDDGTAARLGPDRYMMTTTTANAAKVLQHLDFCCQWLWPDLDVQLVSVTDQWAQYSVTGPHSRDLMRAIVDPAFDISNAAFPYMAAAEITICGGTKARLYRLSFSGELAYEIAVPSRFGDALMGRLMEAGGSFGITPYGTEALGVMRIEKGHLGGPEINGTTTAGDLGLGRMMSTQKDYIGRVLANRPGLTASSRPSLIGLLPVDRAQRFRAGAHLLPRDAPLVAASDQGYVTSVAYSPMNGHWLGLGLLAHGPDRQGEIVRAYDPVRGGVTLVEVAPPAFFDPEGDRLRG